MNSNYQLNEFYAREKMASRLRAAEASRLTSQAGQKNSSPLNKVRTAKYFRQLVAAMVNVYKRVDQERVNAPTLDLTKS